MNIGSNRTLASTELGRRLGVTLVEVALVLSVFLLLILGVMEYSQVMMARAMITAAADQGARLAASGTSKYTTADITKSVKTLLVSQRLSNVKVQVYACDSNGNVDTSISDWADAPFGTGIAVQIDADFPALLPRFGILPNPIKMTSKSIACSEAS